METKMTPQLWWILLGIKLKASMPAHERINYYKSQKQALQRFGLTIK